MLSFGQASIVRTARSCHGGKAGRNDEAYAFR